MPVLQRPCLIALPVPVYPFFSTNPAPCGWQGGSHTTQPPSLPPDSAITRCEVSSDARGEQPPLSRRAPRWPPALGACPAEPSPARPVPSAAPAPSGPGGAGPGARTRGVPRLEQRCPSCSAQLGDLFCQGRACFATRVELREGNMHGVAAISRAGQRNTDHTSPIRDRWGSGLFPQHQQPRTKERKGGENNICSGPPSARL